MLFFGRVNACQPRKKILIYICLILWDFSQIFITRISVIHLFLTLKVCGYFHFSLLHVEIFLLTILVLYLVLHKYEYFEI